MKRNLPALCLLYAAVVTACAGSASSAAGEPDRVSEGAGQGYGGLIWVLVHANGNGIQAIEVLDHQDDAFIGGAAMESLIEAVLDANSTDLDAVSGATESSQGFLEAVRNALQAGT
jgi:uncharacterized protein with FMN-binding domain